MLLSKFFFTTTAFFAAGSVQVQPTQPKINTKAMNKVSQSNYEPSWIEKKIINKLYDEFGRPLDKSGEHYDPNKNIYPV